MVLETPVLTTLLAQMKILKMTLTVTLGLYAAFMIVLVGILVAGTMRYLRYK